VRKPVVAIHQPNFFPWLGYFDKLCRSDVFVMLDDVQFSKTGGNWCNRVRLLEGGKPVWKTTPVRRAALGLQPIRAVEIADEVFWRAKLLNALRTNYGPAPYFGEVMPIVTELVEHATTSLCEFNLHAIDTLLGRLGVAHGRVVRQSELGIEGHGAKLLVDLVAATGGRTYLSGDGSQGYLEPPLFKGAGIDLEYQKFQHPVYAQRGVETFVAGLSIVDALMWTGFAAVGEMVKRARLAREATGAA
jgi:WbqC-like protein family